MQVEPNSSFAPHFKSVNQAFLAGVERLNGRQNLDQQPTVSHNIAVPHCYIIHIYMHTAPPYQLFAQVKNIAELP